MGHYKSGRRKPNSILKARILIEQEGRCCYCNVSLFNQIVHWDHIIPFSYTGTNSKGNWSATCSDCNRKKNNTIFRNEDDVLAFSLEMIKLHGSLGEGWPENSDMWQQSLYASI